MLSVYGVYPHASSIASGLAIFRLVRTARLVKKRPFGLLRRIIETLLFGLPSIANVFLLLMLEYILFALIGCLIFKGINLDPEYQNSIYGFDNFHRAMMMLVKCSTGEDWGSVMYAYGSTSATYVTSRAYFMTFVLFTTFIMLVLLELVVVQIFENFYFNPDSALTLYREMKTNFDRTWNAFTVETKGQKIYYQKLVRFFAHLQEPLGFRSRDSLNEDPVERVILMEEQFRIRRPISAIAILISMNNLPMYMIFDLAMRKATCTTCPYYSWPSNSHSATVHYETPLTRYLNTPRNRRQRQL